MIMPSALPRATSKAFYSQPVAIYETASVLMATLETALSEQYEQYKQCENVCFICSLWKSKTAFNSYDGEKSLE